VFNVILKSKQYS